MGHARAAVRLKCLSWKICDRQKNCLENKVVACIGRYLCGLTLQTGKYSKPHKWQAVQYPVRVRVVCVAEPVLSKTA